MKIKALEPGGFLYRILFGLMIFFVRLWMFTVRARVIDKNGIVSGEDLQGRVCAFWHNRLIAVPFLLPSVVRLRTVAMASRSRDGQLISDLLGACKIRTIRGSAMKNGKDKGGASALRASIEIVKKESCLLALIPDGPRGPVYTVQPGAVAVAARTGAELIPVAITYSAYFTLPTWDKLQVPWPFSRVTIHFGPPMNVSELDPADRSALKEAGEKLRVVLNELSEAS